MEFFARVCGDFIRKNNCVPRRFGLDDFLELFRSFGGDCFGIGGIGIPVALSSINEFPIFDEVSIFDDVVASLGESCIGFRSFLDVGVSGLEVEVGGIADRRFAAELDEDVMVRVSILMEFLGDDDVKRSVVGRFEFIDEKIKEFLIIKIRLRVGEKNVFGTEAEIVVWHLG